MADLRAQLDAAIGGSYELPDGRSFWIDAAAAREILNRIMPVVTGQTSERTADHEEGAA